ncbi:hypothetical protein HZB07_06675 [Candidatus Saganbacteria bacterium]|nr:hypothetical protein [Candidatus Saganbacteria bacterium]
MAITNKDVEKLKEVFATREDLKAGLSGLRREVMGALDDVMNELVKAREDRTLAIGKDREQDRRLDSVEGRLAKVEAGNVI